MARLTIKKSKIKDAFNKRFEVSDWYNWQWQIKHTIRDIETFEKNTGIVFDKYVRGELQKTIERFPLAITPYYCSLIDVEDYEQDPIFRQAFPAVEELKSSSGDMSDPLHEDSDSPVPGVTHRYPDRVLFLVSNICSIYCRHCTRKRKVGDKDSIPNKTTLKKGIKYIKDNPKYETSFIWW